MAHRCILNEQAGPIENVIAQSQRHIAAEDIVPLSRKHSAIPSARSCVRYVIAMPQRGAVAQQGADLIERVRAGNDDEISQAPQHEVVRGCRSVACHRSATKCLLTTWVSGNKRLPVPPQG